MLKITDEDSLLHSVVSVVTITPIGSIGTRFGSTSSSSESDRVTVTHFGATHPGIGTASGSNVPIMKEEAHC
jgi:hypothetical protein